MRVFPTRITVLFVAVVAATLGGAALSSRMVEAHRSRTAQIGSAWRALAATERVRSLLRDADAAAGEYAASGTARARERYAAAAREANVVADALATALADRPDCQCDVASVSSDLEAALGALACTPPPLALGLAVGPVGAAARPPGAAPCGGASAGDARAALARVEAGISDLQGRVRAELARAERAAARSATASAAVIGLTDAALLILVCIAAFSLRGHLRERERRDAEHRRVLDLQQQLLGIVGHDLRTPLNAIAGSAALLASAPDLPSGRVRAVQRILSSAGRMSRLVRDLLDFSRTRSGAALTVSPEHVHLGELCRKVLQEVRAARGGTAVQLVEEGDLAGEWDPARLEQIVSNLVLNACQHGRGTLVIVHANGKGNAVVVEVHNEGQIPADVLPNLFEPFHRGGAATGEGLGLGLHIVRTLVEAHGGSIAVDSRRGETTFRVSLPRRAAAVVPAAPLPAAASARR